MPSTARSDPTSTTSCRCSARCGSRSSRSGAPASHARIPWATAWRAPPPCSSTESAMHIDLVPAELVDKAVLRNLLELYRYDFSEFTGDDVDEHGLYGYPYLDH